MRTQPHRIALLLPYVILLLISTQHTLRADEPSYRGKSLSLWLQDLAFGRYPDMEKHRAAEEAIRSIGAAAIPVLIDRLRVTSDKLDQVQDIVPALIKSLGDKDCDVRWRAARSLGDLQATPELSVPALVERVRDDPAANVRCYAIMALAKFGTKAQAAIPVLAKTATDADSSIRSYAREALTAIGPAANKGDDPTP